VDNFLFELSIPMRGLGLADSKVILVGDPSVGKTSIIQQYNMRQFDEEGEATIGASFVSKLIDTSHGPVQVHIWDTAGQERYRGLIPMYSRNAVASLLVVDVTNPKSYENLEMWLSIVQANCARDCQTYVVANKTDLDPVIPLDKLEEWATARSFPFFRTSAKDYKSVAVVFEAVAEQVGQMVQGKTENAAAPQPNTKNEGCC
jgi:small GTP-binding protein